MTHQTVHRPPLTLDQAAEYASVSPRYLRREVQRGHLAVVRLGRLLRFAPADLDEYLGTRRVAVSDARAELTQTPTPNCEVRDG